ncbi:hypothetical protein ABZ816_15120 [Actinosynnema sp. NPDC047251]|uniref:Uncharacterized protein n=1 Tax=Saccharothrix espanaensis (strain ATCC 51144 / DSM 44229 / JCM 9112 / NBRC 15066 / NRRL 15764) TaxID=1179773 RepID=K0JY72_SACES|nr:hypothetical protein [Saccharothrix espanaensis]CCH29649.1 hypothetical protein BN6_23310 [Saccharothrix espanaensis DSM 44229]
MFKKLRDQIDNATRQATERAGQDFRWHAAQFQQEAARQGHDIRPQMPTQGMAAQGFQLMNQDPAMVEFMSLPGEEQIRQQGLANQYGQNLRRLHEFGEPATAVVRTLDRTGVTVAAQPQYTSVLDVTRADGTTYRTTVTHLVPDMTFAQYAPGTRHHVRIDRNDPNNVGVFELLP